MDQGGFRNVDREPSEALISRLREMRLGDPAALPSDDLIQMAESLQKRDLLVLQLTENIQEVLWVGSPDWQQVFYVNRAYERLWGRSCQSLYDRPMSWMDAIVEEDRNKVVADLKEKILTGAALPHFAEYRIATPEGSIRWISARAFPIRNEQGEPYRIAGLAADVTELKLAEQALRESEQRVRIAVKTAGLTIWDWDVAEDTTTWENPSMILFDGQPGKTTYQWWAERIHPEDRNSVLSTFNTALDGGEESLVVEYRFRLPDGNWGNVYDHAHIMRDQLGKAYRVIGAVMDVTALRRAEEELRQARDELERRVQERTAELSHTIEALHNEVLRRMAAEHTANKRSEQLQILAADLTRAEERERQRVSQVLHDGLQQFLVGAKFRLSPLAIASEDSDVRHAIKEASALIDKSIEISRSLSQELKSPISGDGLVAYFEWLVSFMRRTHEFSVDLQVDKSVDSMSENVTRLLFQSARELLLNVVKHAGVKAAHVKLSQSADKIQLMVSDAGKGFNPANLSQDQSGLHGTGLCDIRERLNLVGGRMVIDSAPGRGARFILTVPHNLLI